MSGFADTDDLPPGVFEPDRVVRRLTDVFPQPRRYCVGFSGGVDSTVLLHILARSREALPAPLIALHVDHGLQPATGAWRRHCATVCDDLGIPLTESVVDARPAPGESPEAAARRARYAAFDRCLGQDDLLLTAHQLDDQAETLLLQLLRGAGIDGLAAMPAAAPRNGYWHARPLLGWSRRALVAWAKAAGLRWIEDPSNHQTVADRNFLRNRVFPLLGERWPAVAQVFSRSASHCADAARALRDQAAQDMAPLLHHSGLKLSLDGLRELDASRQRRVVRDWLRQAGIEMPGRRRLVEALQQFLHAGPDRQPMLGGRGWSIRRYRDHLWLVGEIVQPESGERVDWDGAPLDLGPGRGRLMRRLGEGGIDPGRWPNGLVQLGFNLRSIRCTPAGRTGGRSFKSLVQEAGIPPWQRPQLPLLFIDGRLAAIAGVCVAADFAAPPGRNGWVIGWEPCARHAFPHPRSLKESR